MSQQVDDPQPEWLTERFQSFRADIGLKDVQRFWRVRRLYRHGTCDDEKRPLHQL
jgi:hypothetical protein